MNKLFFSTAIALTIFSVSSCNNESNNKTTSFFDDVEVIVDTKTAPNLDAEKAKSGLILMEEICLKDGKCILPVTKEEAIPRGLSVEAYDEIAYQLELAHTPSTDIPAIPDSLMYEQLHSIVEQARKQVKNGKLIVPFQ